MSVITVTDATFQKEVLEASKIKPVLVEFSTRAKENKQKLPNASAKMDAVIDELDAVYAEQVKFVRVEIELDPDFKDTLNPVTSNMYAINHGPTTVLIKTVEEIAEIVGGYDRKYVEDKLKAFAGIDNGGAR
ncbi:thioredoxin [Pseudomonas syringae group sp. 26L6]|uniref:thioredoxin family protein n=1 Tax=Pseudomonas syringae group sp. 26L6 TaxID=3079591 RepID=UPI00290BD634|nr:thioredoxin [Pseudomonas syringae group sp. 26L6]MDU8644554.1 thioredoxin [Pseudomonas syringae group sp. 26L6]